MKRVGGGNGRGGFLPMKLRSGRHVLVREPPAKKVKICLNDVVVSHLKQLLPVFRAVELSSLNKRFAKTAFEKPTISLDVKADDSNLVTVILNDEREAARQLYYEERKLAAVPIEALADMLSNITDKQIVRSLLIRTPTHVPLVNVLLGLKKLSPALLTMWGINCRQPSFVALIERFAIKVQEAIFLIDREDDQEEDDNADVDWRKLDHCLKQFANLQYLYVTVVDEPPPTSICWLSNAIKNNGNLKQLVIDDTLLYSPIVADARSVVASVSDIRIRRCYANELLAHVDRDLCGLGQCTLTRLVLSMPETGRLSVKIVDCPGVFCGDLLRLACYLLSLSKTGKKVVVRMELSHFESVADFLADLANFYSPQLLPMKTGTDDDWYDCRVRMRRVAIYFKDCEGECQP